MFEGILRKAFQFEKAHEVSLSSIILWAGIKTKGSVILFEKFCQPFSLIDVIIFN